MTRSRLDRPLLAVALVGILGLLAWRVIDAGFVPVAPDDAEYIGVGRRLWVLDAPTRVDGTLYTIRSYVWPLIVGAASHVVPGDPLRGARAMGVVCAAVALVACVLFGYRRSGGLGAVAVGVAIAVTPVVWELGASTRVDVALLAFLAVALCLAAEPSPRRVVAAGVVGGLTLLVKESSALIGLVPLAWLGSFDRVTWWRYARRYWLAFALTVSWWFLFILVERGEVFPFQGLEQAARRDVPRAWTLGTTGKLLVASWVLGAAVLVARRRRSLGIRVLLLTWIALVPAALIAWTEGFALRQFGPLALIGAVIVGLATVEVIRLVVRVSRPGASAVSVAAVGSLLIVTLATPMVLRVHDTVFDYAEDSTDRQLADWIHAHVDDGARVLSSFRYQALVWVREGDRVDFDLLGVASRRSPPDVADQVWLDWSDGAFHFLPRSGFERQLRGTDVLLLTGQHRLSPAALAAWLDRRGADRGFRPVFHVGDLHTDRKWGTAFRVGDPDVARLPTVLTVAALDHLPDETVADLSGIVLAGTPAELRRGTARIRDLGGRTPSRVTVGED